jgi:hypothetical protein
MWSRLIPVTVIQWTVMHWSGAQGAYNQCLRDSLFSLLRHLALPNWSYVWEVLEINWWSEAQPKRLAWVVRIFLSLTPLGVMCTGDPCTGLNWRSTIIALTPIEWKLKVVLNNQAKKPKATKSVGAQYEIEVIFIEAPFPDKKVARCNVMYCTYWIISLEAHFHSRHLSLINILLGPVCKVLV